MSHICLKTMTYSMVLFYLQCKHQLGVFLSDALDKTTFKTVDELVLAEILIDLSQ